MNPFVWVLVNWKGDAEEIISDRGDVSLDQAWTAFCNMHGRGSRDCMQDDGYRVLRCKLVEVGPA